jgi:hypothetical protein
MMIIDRGERDAFTHKVVARRDANTNGKQRFDECEHVTISVCVSMNDNRTSRDHAQRAMQDMVNDALRFSRS